MGGRTAIVVGLGAGIVAGVALIAVVAAILPPPAMPVATASPAASGSPSASPASPSGSPAGTESPDAGEANFHVGQPAPPLRLPQLGGGEIDLANLRGTPVWVNFMATWCPPCRDEIPLMNSFAVRYAEDDLVIVAVEVREDVGTVNAFVQELTVTFPVALDEDGAAQQAWGAYALPVHFWIDREGIVRDGALGGIGPDLMVAALEKILPGVDIEP